MYSELGGLKDMYGVSREFVLVKSLGLTTSSGTAFGLCRRRAERRRRDVLRKCYCCFGAG